MPFGIHSKQCNHTRMKVVNIADELFRELGQPSELSIPAISYWLRTNIGQLNNHLNECYRLNEIPDGHEIVTDAIDKDRVPIVIEISEEAKAVIKKMYTIHFYENKLRSNLAAAGTDSVISVADDGSNIRKINKNEVSKVYLNIIKNEIEELRKLIYAYQRSQGEPLQVAGDDTIAGYYDPEKSITTETNRSIRNNPRNLM